VLEYMIGSDVDVFRACGWLSRPRLQKRPNDANNRACALNESK